MVFCKYATTVVLNLIVISCCAQNYIIKGKIKGIDTGWAYIRHREWPGIDSGQIISGKFVINGKVKSPEFCAFGLSVNRKKDYYLSFFLESKKLIFIVDTASLNDISIQITGSIVERQFQHFQVMVANANKSQLRGLTLNEKLEHIARGFALRHPQSYVSAFAIYSYEHNLNKLSRLFYSLSAKVQKSHFGQKIAEELNSH